MSLNTLELRVIGGLALVGALAAAALVFWPETPTPEVVTAAPQVRQADGSVVAQRAQDPHPAPAPHILPKGSIEERRESVTVAPSAAAAASGCPPVHVDLSIVRVDGGQRAVVSSPDGTVIDAKDIPIEAGIMPPAPKPWAAGLSYDTQHAVGVWLDRDIGRLVVGAAVQRLQDGRAEAQIRVGVRF